MPDDTVPNPEYPLACPDCEVIVRQLQKALDRNARLFDAMLSHSRDGIVLTGPDGRIVRMVRSMAGYGPVELAGLPVEMLIHPEDRDTVRDCYRRLLSRAAASIEDEVRILRPDGSFLWTEVTVTDMLDVPEVQAIVCNYSDITLRKEHELVMAEFEAIVKSSDYAIFSRDAAGQILTWNRGAENMFGYAAGEITGRHGEVLVPEELWEEERTARKRAFETGEASEFRTERLHKDGSRIPVDLQLSPVLDRDGRVRGFSHVSRRVR
jgi:PAS domain S-box-containing protein